MTARRMKQRGSALLAVLWLVAALSAISFAIANTVRSETERTGTDSESLRAHYLATGAVERALLYMSWGNQVRNPDGTPKYYDIGTARLNFTFPSGVATVEIIPESSKINVNTSVPEEIASLLRHLGVAPERATQITAAIVDWRNPSPQGLTEYDQFYAGLHPSFRARHASLEEVEELLLVKGMTPELFYGTYVRDQTGQLVPTGGLRNCVSVYAAPNSVDVNTAEPAVLATIGIEPDTVRAIIQRRHAAPFRNMGEVAAFAQGGGAGIGRLKVGGSTLFTLRATAQLRLPNGGISDLRRTVGAMVKFREYGYTPPIETLRWYDN